MQKASNRPSPYQWQRAYSELGRQEFWPSTQPDPQLDFRFSTRPSVLEPRAAGCPPRAERLQAKLVKRLQSRLVEKNELIAELMQEHVQLKKELGGALNGAWVPHDTRGQVVDYVARLG